MKKKLIAGMTSTALIASIGAPAFAANFNDVSGHWAAATINKLADAGIINGLDASNFAPDATLTRAQFAKMISVALKLDTTSTTSSFSDVSGWAVGYVEAAKKAGIINGTDATHFDPNGTLTREQAAAIMVRALKTQVTLQDGSDINFPDAAQVSSWFKTDVATAIKYGLLNGKDGNLAPQGNATRAEAAVLTDRFLTKSEELKVVTEFKVDSVNAINLKQVKVVFSKAVDATTAEDVNNYSVTTTTNAASALVADATLQDDGKTVILTLAGYYTNQDSGKSLTIATVKSADKTQVVSNYTVNNLSYVDTTAPTILSAASTGPRTIKVTFSEPVHQAAYTLADFKVDGGAVALNAGSVATENAATNSVTINTATDLTAGSHTVEVNSSALTTFADYAGFPVVKQSISFNHTIPTDAPVATVSKATPTSITLKFNRSVREVDAASVYANYASITPTSVVGANTGLNGATDYDTEWTLTFAQPLSGAVNVVIKNNGATKAEDRFGNDIADQNLPVSVIADSTKPEVASVTARAANQLRVSFNKDVVEADAEYLYNYTIKDASGVVLDATTSNGATDNQGHPATGSTFVYTTTNDYVDITLPANLPSGNYQVEIKNVKDTVSYEQHTMDTVTKTFTVADTSSMALSSATFNGSNKITLNFSKDVATNGDGSALNVANYLIDADGVGGTYSPVALPANSSVTLGGANNQVVITLGSTPTGFGAGASTIYATVKTASGSAINPAQNVATVNGAAAVALSDIRNVKLLGSNQVSFEVKQPLSGADANGITVAGVAATGVSVQNKVFADGIYGALVTVSVADGALETSTFGTAPVASLRAAGAGSDPASQVGLAIGALTNTYNLSNGSALAYTAKDVADKSAASIASYTTADSNNNGQIDTLTVVYSEAVQLDSVTPSSFGVSGYTVSSIYSGTGAQYSTSYVIKLQESGQPDTGAKPSVTQLVAAKDAAGNTKAAETSASKATTDASAPRIIAVNRVNATTVTVTFSEALKDTTVLPAAFTLLTAATDTATVTSATLSADKKTVTVVASGATIAAGDTVAVDASVTDNANVANATTSAQTL